MGIDSRSCRMVLLSTTAKLVLAWRSLSSLQDPLPAWRAPPAISLPDPSIPEIKQKPPVARALKESGDSENKSKPRLSDHTNEPELIAFAWRPAANVYCVVATLFAPPGIVE